MKLLKKIGKLWMVVWLFVTVLDGIAAIPIYLLDIPCLKIVKDMMHTKDKSGLPDRKSVV